ncbi:MAG TPA: nuclear transport factor 2 family protein [Solirubrobacteraceae bacterium]|nr:nuclear transport factor 2 family protein [Solirubrobacteraceae bacterium]
MSEDEAISANVELVRSIYADWERGNFGRADWVDPEIEYLTEGGPDPGGSTGLAPLAAANRDFLSLWTDWRIHADSFRALDGERVLVLTSRGGRGRASGLEIWEPSANLFHIRDGRVTRLVFYWHRERALADLGLED